MRILWMALALLTAGLAGCAGAGGDDGAPQGTDTDEKETTVAGKVARLLFESDLISGEVPLEVVFAAEVRMVAQGAAPDATGTAYDGGLAWVLAFGDGSAAVTGDETDFLSVIHVYNTGGSFSSSLEVTLEDGTELAGEIAIDAMAGPALPDFVIRHVYTEDYALLPFPVYDESVAKQMYDDGLNGTTVLGYEIAIGADAKRLYITTAVDADPTTASDYDLFLFGPDGGFVIDSGNSGAEEEIDVKNPGEGTWLLVVLNFSASHPSLTGALTTTIEHTYPGSAAA